MVTQHVSAGGWLVITKNSWVYSRYSQPTPGLWLVSLWWHGQQPAGWVYQTWTRHLWQPFRWCLQGLCCLPYLSPVIAWTSHFCTMFPSIFGRVDLHLSSCAEFQQSVPRIRQPSLRTSKFRCPDIWTTSSRTTRWTYGQVWGVVALCGILASTRLHKNREYHLKITEAPPIGKWFRLVRTCFCFHMILHDFSSCPSDFSWAWKVKGIPQL